MSDYLGRVENHSLIVEIDQADTKGKRPGTKKKAPRDPTGMMEGRTTIQAVCLRVAGQYFLHLQHKTQ